MVLSTQDDAIQSVSDTVLSRGAGVFCGGMFMLFGRAPACMSITIGSVRHGVGPRRSAPPTARPVRRSRSFPPRWPAPPSALPPERAGDLDCRRKRTNHRGRARLESRAVEAGRRRNRPTLRTRRRRRHFVLGRHDGDGPGDERPRDGCGRSSSSASDRPATDRRHAHAGRQSSQPPLSVRRRRVWNGIVDGFGVMLVNDAPWFAFLFIAIFLLIGVALIGGVIHAAGPLADACADRRSATAATWAKRCGAIHAASQESDDRHAGGAQARLPRNRDVPPRNKNLDRHARRLERRS